MPLFSMESLFIKIEYKIAVLFGHYNHFNDVMWKTKEKVREELYKDLLAYKIQKMAYVQKYGKFDFSDDPPIEKIIEIVKQWRNI